MLSSAIGLLRVSNDFIKSPAGTNITKALVELVQSVAFVPCAFFRGYKAAKANTKEIYNNLGGFFR
jgi:hypothetical protein